MEGVLDAPGHPQPGEGQAAVQETHAQGADQTEFLADDGEDEVTGRLRDVQISISPGWPRAPRRTGRPSRPRTCPGCPAGSAPLPSGCMKPVRRFSRYADVTASSSMTRHISAIIPAKMRPGVPMTHSSVMKMTSSTNVVPRSSPAMTSMLSNPTPGSSGTSRCRQSSSWRSRCGRAGRRPTAPGRPWPARTAGRGNGPSWIQREAPFWATPTPGMRVSPRPMGNRRAQQRVRRGAEQARCGPGRDVDDRQPDRGAEQLLLEVGVRGQALAQVLHRRGQHHHQPEPQQQRGDADNQVVRRERAVEQREPGGEPFPGGDGRGRIDGGGQAGLVGGLLNLGVHHACSTHRVSAGAQPIPGRDPPRVAEEVLYFGNQPT